MHKLHIDNYNNTTAAEKTIDINIIILLIHAII